MSNLDTRNKRSSAINMDLYWMRVYPNPGTTINAQYRQQIGLKYAGTFSAPTVSPSANVYRLLMGCGG